MALSTHILDTSIGKPAAGVQVELEILEKNVWKHLQSQNTDGDGRIKSLVATGSLQKSVYRLRFFTKKYFESQKRETFYPFVEVVFEVINEKENFHVPLLLNGYGFSTYRGS